MSTAYEELADAAPRPVDLLARVADAHARSEAAQLEVLTLAAAWADAHPALEPRDAWDVPQPGPPPASGAEQVVALSEWDSSLLDAAGNLAHDADEDAVGWAGVPAVAWDAPAAFAAAIGSSTAVGRATMRDALVLRHRLPQTWAEILAGRVPVWRGRRVAAGVLGAPSDVVEAVDERLAPVAGSITPAQLDTMLDEEMLRLHAEARELEQLEALDSRRVTLDDTLIGHTGIGELLVRGDWADLTAVYATLTRLASALRDPALVAVAGCVAPGRESEVTEATLDVRRAIAAGVLADPDRAHRLLAALDRSSDRPDPGPDPRLARRADLVVHLTDAALRGLDPVARVESVGPALVEVVRAWLARTDTHVRVRPVIDLDVLADQPLCTERQGHDEYRPADWLTEAVGLLHPTCVHPYCGRPARSCDCDHTIPWPHGPTCIHNLAPLCRHHHRLKTHAAWTCEAVDPVAGVYHWTSPHGFRFIVDRRGTRPLAAASQ